MIEEGEFFVAACEGDRAAIVRVLGRNTGKSIVGPRNKSDVVWGEIYRIPARWKLGGAYSVFGDAKSAAESCAEYLESRAKEHDAEAQKCRRDANTLNALLGK